eukprot:scaffold96245_cov15-Tisochrysis_lutea.AAC.1
MLNSLPSQRQPPSHRGEAGKSTQHSQKFTYINQSPGFYHALIDYKGVTTRSEFSKHSLNGLKRK